MKTVDFSKNIAASDLKVSRTTHLIEYMKVCEYCRSRSFLDRPWPKVVYIQKFKPDFLRIYCADLNQISYESFQIQGNENLMA